MKTITGLLLLLAIAPMPAWAESQESDCLSRPTYACLVSAAAAAGEAEPDTYDRASIFAYLAGTQAAIGRRIDAASSLDRALGCDALGETEWARQYLAVLVVWAKAGIAEFDQARMLAAHVDDPYYSTFAWSSLAEGQVLNGDKKGALHSLNMAKIAATEVNALNRASLDPFLGVSFAQAGLPDEAHRFAQTAYDIDEEAEGLFTMLEAFAVSAVAEAMAGHHEDSRVLIDNVRERQDELEDQGDLFWILGNVAWAHAELGDRKATLSVMREMAELDLPEMGVEDKAYGLAVAAMALHRARD